MSNVNNTSRTDGVSQAGKYAFEMHVQPVETYLSENHENHVLDMFSYENIWKHNDTTECFPLFLGYFHFFFENILDESFQVINAGLKLLLVVVVDVQLSIFYDLSKLKNTFLKVYSKGQSSTLRASSE